jgi:transposase
MTLTYADAHPGVPDDGSMGSSAGPRAGQPKRRAFTPEYKLAMVAEYDRLPAGEKGRLLRREGLYHSHIIEWRRARDAGTLSAPAKQSKPQKRSKSAEQAEIERLRRANERLEADLARSRAALDVVGKAHALLEMLSESAPPTRDPKSKR